MNILFPIVTAIMTVANPASVEGTPQVPKPPPVGLELLSSTNVSHALSIECGVSRFRMEWVFAGDVTSIKSARFNGDPYKKSELTKIDAAISKSGMKGDVLAFAQCANEGTSVHFIEGRLAGTVHAKVVIVNLIDGKVTLIASPGER